MKRISFALFLPLFGCAAMYAGYTASTMINTSGEERKYEPVGAKAYGTETEHLKVSYVPDVADAGVSFNFENKTDKVVRIIWDETTFLGADGQSERVLHEGITLKDRNASQPASIIPPLSKLADSITPTSKVEWDTRIDGSGSWKYSPLCGTKNFWTQRLEDDACLGKSFGFFITYEVDGKKKNVTLRYKYLAKGKTEPARATAGK